MTRQDKVLVFMLFIVSWVIVFGVGHFIVGPILAWARVCGARL